MSPEDIVQTAYVQTAGNWLLTPIACQLLADLRNTVPDETEDGAERGHT